MRRRPQDESGWNRSGLSLTEVLVCLAILALVSLPLFGLFSTSRRLGVSARDLDGATGLASSYLSALTGVDVARFEEFGPLADDRLPAPVSLEALRVATAPPPYRRSVTLLRIRTGPTPTPLWHAVVSVEWPSRRNDETLRFRLGRFLR